MKMIFNRRYKIIFSILSVLVFSFVFKYINNPINTYTQMIANKVQYSDACSTGSGTVYYVDASSAYMTSAPVLSAADKNSTTDTKIPNCSVVRVYCKTTSGGHTYYKISKTENMYIMDSYLKNSLPASCSSTKTTTTISASYTLGNVTSVPQTNYDKMYADKNGEFKVAISNIRHVASDDTSRFKYVVYDPSGNNVTNRFDIDMDDLTISSNVGSTTLYLKMNTGSYTYSAGNYTVGLMLDNTNYQSKTFTIVGDYYNYDLSVSAPSDTSSSSYQTWTAYLTNEAGMDFSSSNFNLKITKDGTTYYDTNSYTSYDNFSAKFSSSSTHYIAFNYDPSNYSLGSGTYLVTVGYNDLDSSARGTLTRTFNITLSGRSVNLTKKAGSMFRYIKGDYAIDIYRVYNNTVYYYENSTMKSEDTTSFADEFTDITINSIAVDSNGYVKYAYSDACIITNVLNGNVTYLDASAVSHTVTQADFETAFPGAYAALTTAYDIYSDGHIMLKKAGSGSRKTLSTINQTIRASGGGEFLFNYGYKNLSSDDLDLSEIKISRTSDNKVVYQKSCTTSGIWWWKSTTCSVTTNDSHVKYSWSLDSSTSTLKIKLLYYNDSATADEDYAGSYRIDLDFYDSDTQTINFSLEEGELNYYLKASVDAHLDTTDPMSTVYPPGNKTYEYNLGFYMLKGDSEYYKYNTSQIETVVYDHQANLDENGNLYFFDQTNYTMQLVSYDSSTGAITYKLGKDATVLSGNVNDSAFKSKYSDIIAMLPYYKFDSSTHALVNTPAGDGFTTHVTKYYENNNVMYIDYIDSSGTTHTGVLASNYGLVDADTYVYIVSNYNFDTSGNIIYGDINGSYNTTVTNGKDVSSLFDITVNSDTSDITKVIKVLPKTEVSAGTYYVYVKYNEALIGVGYKNYYADENQAIITKSKYPEMWNRNTHMVPITYSNPIYDINMRIVTYSNNYDSYIKSMYYKVSSTATINATPIYIHDTDSIKMYVDRCSAKSGTTCTTWVDDTSEFTLSNNFDNTDYGTTYYVNITNKAAITPGTYRLRLEYTNADGIGLSAPITKEFDASAKYYGIIVDDKTTGTVNYAHNYTQTKNIYLDGYYLSNPSNLKSSISFKSGSGEMVDLVLEDNIFYYVDANGNKTAYFTYTMDKYSTSDANKTHYEYHLSNYTDVTQQGTYTITFYYTEDSGETVSDTFEFSVGADQYSVDLSNEYAKSTDTELSFSKDFTTAYISKDKINNISVVVYYYDDAKNAYVDVSSSNVSVENRHISDISFTIDNCSGVTCTGKVKFVINKNKYDTSDNADYYIEVSYPAGSNKKTYTITPYNKLFGWDIKLSSIVGTYTDTDGTKTTVNGFYNNLSDTTITFDLTNTFHENAFGIAVNKNCSSKSSETCTTTDVYSQAFDITYTYNEAGQINGAKLVYNGKVTLTPGYYGLVLYYSTNDFRVLDFRVKSEYVNIVIDDFNAYSISNSKYVNGLFTNINGYVRAPVSVAGVSDLSKMTVKVIDASGNSVSSLAPNISKFIDNKLVYIDYVANELKEANDYTLVVSYTDADNEEIKATQAFTMNKTYFNLYFGDTVTTDPSPLIPNAVNGGKATFTLNIEDVPYLYQGADSEASSSAAQKIADGTKIYSFAGDDVTNLFKVTYAFKSYSDFYLIVSYDNGAIVPDEYTVKSSYTIDGYTITTSSYFVVGDYMKSISVSNDVQIISNTGDSKIHRNTGGTFRINYTSFYGASTSDINVKVSNSSSQDVTSSFVVDTESSYIDVNYNPKSEDKYLPYGDYIITVTYKNSGDSGYSVTLLNVHIYDIYKDIAINNMRTNSSVVYADLDNQFYNFDLTLTSLLTKDDLTNLEYSVYDAENNDVTSEFAISNNLSDITDTSSVMVYKIQILAFKAPVGKYTIKLKLKDAEGECNSSNALQFAITKTYYKVILDDASAFKPITTYGSDTSKIYDKGGFNTNYIYTTNYPYKDTSVFSIRIYKGLTLVKEINNVDSNAYSEDGVNYLQEAFDTTGVSAGTYNVYVCINGLPYVYKTVEVNPYIAATDFSLIVGGSIIKGNDVTISHNSSNKIGVSVTPTNATDDNFIYTSGNEEIIKVVDGRLIGVSEGSTTLTVNNADVTKTFNVTVTESLSSTKYTVTYGIDSSIYVNSINTLKLSKEAFEANLDGKKTGYSYLDRNKASTNPTNIGTGMYFVNPGDATYRIVVIGDVTKDGNISLTDVAIVFQYVRGKTSITDDGALLAAHIRRADKVTLTDVARLLQFVRGKLDSL